LTSKQVMRNPVYFPVCQEVMRKALPREAMFKLAA
jgi:hypothetical protein